MIYVLEDGINIITEISISEFISFMKTDCFAFDRIKNDFYLYTNNMVWLVSENNFDLENDVFKFLFEVHTKYKDV